MSDVCAQTALWANVCPRHNWMYTGPECPECVAERRRAKAQQRDTVNVLEARIADLEGDLVALRRRVTELEHARIASQAAHNALVAAEPAQP